MLQLRSAIRAAIIPVTLAFAGACANSGLGSVLGSVLGGGGSTVSGTVQSVDPRYGQLYLTDQSGQAVTLAYDNNTQVVYNGRNYSVSNLQRGDQVTVNVTQQQASNGSTVYYASSINVDAPVNSTTNGGSVAGMQQFQGTARQINRSAGTFQLDTGTGTLYVSMPYNASQDTRNRFASMRNGDLIRFYGVVTGNNNVQIYQYY